MVGRDGFEPSKAEPTGLQPVPFGHSGTDPERATVAEHGVAPENAGRSGRYRSWSGVLGDCPERHH